MAAASTTAIVAIAATVVSAAVSAYGAVQQGNAAKNAAEYQSAVNRNNQQVAEWQAGDAIRRGEEAERQHRLRVAGVIGKQKSSMAANGVDLSSGSPLDIIGDTALFAELDALTIRSNAEREAYGYRVQSSNFAANSRLNLMQGSQAQTAGMIGAGATLLGGMGQAAGSWAKFRAPSGSVG
jgi:hypothetical protein